MPVRYRPISRRKSNQIGTPGLTPIDNINSGESSIEPDALTGKIPAQDDESTEKKARKTSRPTGRNKK